MRSVAAFLRLAWGAFLSFAVALILILLPTDVLFRLSSWLLFMGSADIVITIALMVVLLALLSAGLATLIAGVAGAVNCIFLHKRWEEVETAVRAVVALVVAGLIAAFLADIFLVWLRLTFGENSFKAVSGVLQLAIAATLVVWVWRKGIASVGAVVYPRLAKANVVALALTVFSMLTVATKGFALHDPNMIRANPIAPSRAGMPNVILLSIDALSAENMSLHGYHRPTTPRLDAFARESYVFDNFFAASNWTLPSVATLISGLHPLTSGVHPTNSYFLASDDHKNLAQLLTDSGYQTAAIVANARAHPVTLGIDRSFSATTEQPVRRLNPTSRLFDALLLVKDYRVYSWVWDWMEEKVPGLLGSAGERESYWPPQLAFERAFALLGNLKTPSFIWIHILPPHDPYLPSERFRKRFGNFDEFLTAGEFSSYGPFFSDSEKSQIDMIRSRYDEFVLDTDSQVGDFLDALRAAGRLDNSIVIIASDHGESFVSGYLGHGGRLLHQPLTHVPFMVHLPEQKAGKRISHYAGHVDLLPTVAELIDVPIPGWAEGESLKAAMLDGASTRMPKFSMNFDSDSRFSPPAKGTIAVMHGGWKLVRYLDTGMEELYDLAADPGERNDLSAMNPNQARRMRTMIYSRFKLAN